MRTAASAFDVSSRTLRELAGTRPVPANGTLLAAGLHSRRLVLLTSLLTAADRHGVPPRTRQRLSLYWQLLEQADARDRYATRLVLDGPAVGTWLACTLNAPTREAFEDALADFGAVAAAAALRARLHFRVTLPVREAGLMIPGSGLYTVAADRAELTAGPHGLHVTPEGGPHGDRGAYVGPGAPRPAREQLRLPWPGKGTDSAPAGGTASDPYWHRLRRLPGGRTVLDDIDPRRGIVPETPGSGPAGSPGPALPLAPRLSPRDFRRWSASWYAAVSLLEAADPERASEVTSLVRSLVPLRRGSGGAGSSATLRAAPGAVFASLPDTPLQMAEVLVHEVQHSKLAVISDLVPLHRADGTPAYRVGWRPGPRPFAAALQGTYAHLAVADLWHRVASGRGTDAVRTDALERCEHYRRQVAEALDLLIRSGQLTGAGAEFAAGMQEHQENLGRHGRGTVLVGPVSLGCDLT